MARNHADNDTMPHQCDSDCRVLQEENRGDVVINFVGHDHFNYEVRKGYTGSNFVYITRSPGDALPLSLRTKSITVHVDELDTLIRALQTMKTL